MGSAPAVLYPNDSSVRLNQTAEQVEMILRNRLAEAEHVDRSGDSGKVVLDWR